MDPLNSNNLPDISISLEDVENLNVLKLQENMLRSIYLLEVALFSQAGYEYNRINKLRSIIDTVEKDILDEKFIKELNIRDKINLYKLVLESMSKSTGFLNQLHNNVATGLEAVTKIEKLGTKKPIKNTDSEIDNVAIDRIKSLIEKAIKAKINEKE